MIGRIRIILHEAVSLCGSFEVRFPDGRPVRFFYWDDVPGACLTARLRSEKPERLPERSRTRWTGAPAEAVYIANNRMQIAPTDIVSAARESA